MAPGVYDNDGGPGPARRLSCTGAIIALVLVAVLGFFFRAQIQQTFFPKKQVFEDDGMVYFTNDFTLYHRKGCKMLHGEFEAGTLEEAKRLHLRPCPECKPPE